MDLYKSIAREEIDRNAAELNKLGAKIWKLAEAGGQEVKTCKAITRFLKKREFTVTKNFGRSRTAFKAEFGDNDSRNRKRPNIAFLCSYDAIRKLGHVTGNNLVVEVCLAAALGLQAVLKCSATKLGKVVVIGSPDSAGGGLVPKFTKEALRNIDVVLTAVPGPKTDWNPKHTGSKCFRTIYKGTKGDPQTATPPGNALDGAVLALQNVMAVQEHFGQGWQIQGVISEGGKTCNERPVQCETLIKISAPTTIDMTMLEKRVRPCLDAAATATNCEYDVNLCEVCFSPLINNTLLAYLLQLNAYHTGVLATPLRKREVLPPTDVGNVSRVVPTIRPMFYIGADVAIGTDEFKLAAKTNFAHCAAIAMGKALAMTAVDVMETSSVLINSKVELKGVLQKEKEFSFMPFVVNKVAKYRLKTDMPPDSNTGWSRNL